ncbi:MAG: zinc ribbon domain-containing protein [Dehalococcoidales bacterium]|nr:zinc ribbon domain-containing protein [Dehalococcoidales bacterium]
MKIRYFLLAFIAIILALGMTLPAFAETNAITGFKNVTVWVNPEYDNSRLLVMLEGKISGATPPVQVRFLVPSGAEMFSAGSKDATGKYTGGPPDRKASATPGWDEISYELKTDTFRVEYYDDSIKGQPDKKIAYDFLRLYPLSDLRVVVQQPRKSTNFTVEPKGSPGTDNEGFTISSYSYTNLSVDQSVHFDISYTKSDPNPSLQNAPLSSQPATASSNTGDPAFFAISIVVVVILIVSMFVWVIRRQKPGRPVRQPSKVMARATARQPGRANPAPRNASGGSPKGQFCAGCGHAAEKRAKFCPYCGKHLAK